MLLPWSILNKSMNSQLYFENNIFKVHYYIYYTANVTAEIFLVNFYKTQTLKHLFSTPLRHPCLSQSMACLPDVLLVAYSINIYVLHACYSLLKRNFNLETFSVLPFKRSFANFASYIKRSDLINFYFPENISKP